MNTMQLHSHLVAYTEWLKIRFALQIPENAILKYMKERWEKLSFSERIEEKAMDNIEKQF